MPRFEYQFDTRIDDSGRRFKRRLRLVVLFLFISVITAGIIYFIIPGKGEKKDADTPPNNSISQADTQAEKNVSVKSDAADAVNSSAETPTGTQIIAENQNTGVKEDIIQLDKQETSDQNSIKEPLAMPEKGKVWAGDPVNDVPAEAANKNSVSVLDELKLLADSGKWNQLADKAGKTAEVENEGSSNYRTAVKYLLAARIKQLESKDGVPGVSFRYVVRSGDSLSRIASRNKTTVAALMHSNKLSSGLIHIGSKLTVHPGPWSITISKNNRLLKLYQGSEKRVLFAVFEVGLGRFNSTPAGGFVISSRIKSPRWYAPDGSVYEPGEPGNELGNYFLKLAATGTPDRPLTGYGIHGTPDESTVGKSLSHGCVRMRNADVELLYNLVPERTPVTITE